MEGEETKFSITSRTNSANRAEIGAEALKNWVVF